MSSAINGFSFISAKNLIKNNRLVGALFYYLGAGNFTLVGAEVIGLL